MSAPETRPSLLMRVRDPHDCDAWDEFSQIYRPLICRMANLKGLQHADADDLAQQVLLAVSKAIETWEHDSDRAKFRTWLKRIATNAILNAINRRKPDGAIGSEAAQNLLMQLPATSGADSELLETEYRREIFAWAARKIRPEFTNETWQSFWLTSVETASIDDAVRILGRSRGSVYASRSRVMKRLREQIAAFDDDAPGPLGENMT